MTDTKHTPGPWALPAESAYTLRKYIANGGIPVKAYSRGRDDYLALNTVTGVGEFGADAVANARLIAAAPELLAALEDAEFLLRKAGIHPKDAPTMAASFARSAKDAREAIAKATGRE
jgi:hypothetical protein